MTKDEALKLALETLECWQRNEDCNEPMSKILEAIKKVLAQPEITTGNILMDSYNAMQSMKVEGPRHVVCQCDKCKAQPEQEPVAWWNDTGTHIDLNVSGRGTPLYTHPLQRTWVGLTAKEKHEFRYSHMTTADFIEVIEAKLKEKNTRGQE